MPPEPTARPLRVLVVEDHPDCAESLILLVTSWGHETRLASDGRSGLKTADAFLPEVVLLDLLLPDLDGWEVCRQLRQHPALGGSLIVALTGSPEANDPRRSFEAGFDLHLLKPVEPYVLFRLLAGETNSAGWRRRP